MQEVACNRTVFLVVASLTFRVERSVDLQCTFAYVGYVRRCTSDCSRSISNVFHVPGGGGRLYEVVNLVLLTTGQHPSKPLYFIGPYDQHHLLVSGIGALLCHHLHCFPSQSQTLFGIGAGPLLIYNGVCIFATFLKAERERMHFFFLNRGQKSCAAVSRPKPYQSPAPGLPGWLT